MVQGPRRVSAEAWLRAWCSVREEGVYRPLGQGRSGVLGRRRTKPRSPGLGCAWYGVCMMRVAATFLPAEFALLHWEGGCSTALTGAAAYSSSSSVWNNCASLQCPSSGEHHGTMQGRREVHSECTALFGIAYVWKATVQPSTGFYTFYSRSP